MLQRCVSADRRTRLAGRIPSASTTMHAFDPWRSESPLIVYLDIKSPYAFVARDSTRALATRIGIDVDWRPLTLDIPSYLGSARKSATGKVVENKRSASQWDAVRYAYRDARREATRLGHTLLGTTKIWDTSLAHIGFMWARRQGDAVLQRFLDVIYPPFWRRELDIEALEVIERLLIAAGADVDGFAAWSDDAGRSEHDAMQAAIFDAGIFGVPSYVVEGELFFGREHLPRVAWMLSGQPGPAPDVAYADIDAMLPA